MHRLPSDKVIAAVSLTWGQSLAVIGIVAALVLLAGGVILWGRRRTPSASIVRSWIAVSLVSALIILTTLTFAVDDAQTRSTLIGGLAASVGAAIAFYFSSNSADQARQDIMTAAFGSEVVPDLVGKPVSEAAKVIAASSLKLVVSAPTPYTDNMVVNTQDPPPQSVAGQGAKLSVTLTARNPGVSDGDPGS